jgi:prepilin peptidase CpaA
MVGFVALFILTAAALDLRTRRLPNWLTVPAFAAGLVFHTATGGWAGLGLSLGGFATGFGILLVLWLIGGGGGGDVKLMGALGAWLGPMMTLYVFFGSALLATFGMVLLFFNALAQEGFSRASRRYLARRTAGGAIAADESPLAAARRVRQRPMPYALLVAIATWLTLAGHVLIRISS